MAWIGFGRASTTKAAVMDSWLYDAKGLCGGCEREEFSLSVLLERIGFEISIERKDRSVPDLLSRLTNNA
jgi:hypothetical protein